MNISLQGDDVVLRWESRTNAVYIVQYRATLHPHDAWQTLTNFYPAAEGTNSTTFVHSNSVCWPTGSGGSGGGTNASPPGPEGFSSTSSGGGSYPPMPPMPGEYSSSSSEMNALESESSSSFSMSSLILSGNNCNPINTDSNVCSGFYRVFAPTPVVQLDVFGVEQGSLSNQLSVLANDIDPDDNPILLSTVQAASHGEITYSDDASIFAYTPTNTFAGMDVFSYSVTNDVGGSNTTSVFVFVNATGNSHPSAPPLEFTLFTNQTVISFPILTNVTDPDSNTLQLAVIGSPLRGIAATNSSGDLAYTRTSSYLAQDSFFYVLTDGNGGFVKRTVTINPQDDDGDGIPDEWELVHELDPNQYSADGDSDEDGLPNLAEYKLDTCPWTADNPLNLNNVATNQVFREYALISLPLKAHISKPSISLLIDSNRANATISKRSDGFWYVNWDTGYMTNGNYTMGLEFQYRLDPLPGDAPIAGTAKSVIVHNDVMFSQVASSFSDYLVIDVKLAEQTANWTIELFDEQNQYLGYFGGLTTNGLIRGSWNLKNGNGNQIAFSHIRTDFYFTPTNTGALLRGDRKARRWFVKETANGIGDTFVVAWGWDSYTSGFENNRINLMLGGVINVLANPGRNDEYFLRPTANGYDIGAFRYDTDTDKEILMNALKAGDSGNFFWFGHGDVDVLQGNHKRSNIVPGDVEGALKNKKHRSTPKRALANQHPYRLVILNGCNTYSKDWADAFGIDFSPNGTTNDVYAYYQQGRQSQAFVGWTKSIEVPRAGNPNYYSTQYAVGLAALFSMWMDGYALESCLGQYEYYMDDHNFDYHDSWKISGTASMWRTAP